MLEWLWEILAIPFGYLMRWSYLLFHNVLNFPLPYLFAMVLFTLIMRVLQFPLTIFQQRSTAKTAAIQPLIQEIQKKFAKDKNRQQAEIQKLQEEMGISMTAGCLPMLITFPILFVVVEIIYKPLTYMLKIPSELISELSAIVQTQTDVSNVRFIQNDIIKMVQANGPGSSLFASQWASNGDMMTIINDLDLSIGNVYLLDKPVISQPSLLWLFPLFMIVTMFVTQLVTMKSSGQSNQPGGKMTMYMMTALFAVFSFTYPAAFSLYWGLSNLMMMGQTTIVRRIIDPEKIKQQVLDDYQAKKKAKKTAKTVKLKDDKTGETVEKTISAAELARLRLQKARELDDARYSAASSDDAPRSEEEIEALNEDFAKPESEKGKAKGKKKKKK